VFDHVGIAVSDLAASERFYRIVLSVLGVEPRHADAELVEWAGTSGRRTASTR
jgi:catechol 2,3-dioxygenase-like lactoylglutathione lyase family enzyme